jgi:hypothetical protein
MNKINDILIKVYRSYQLTANEIIILTTNAKEPISKITLMNDNDSVKAMIHFENDGHVYACKVVSDCEVEHDGE